MVELLLVRAGVLAAVEVQPLAVCHRLVAAPRRGGCRVCHVCPAARGAVERVRVVVAERLVAIVVLPAEQQHLALLLGGGGLTWQTSFAMCIKVVAFKHYCSPRQQTEGDSQPTAVPDWSCQ